VARGDDEADGFRVFRRSANARDLGIGLRLAVHRAARSRELIQRIQPCKARPAGPRRVLRRRSERIGIDKMLT